jgi:hypothetical protein
MNQELDAYLAAALKKLEEACAQLLKTQAYTKDTEKMKMLYELAKEQVKNENTRHPTR